MALFSLFSCSQNFSDSGVKEALRESNMTPFDAKSTVEQAPELPTSDMEAVKGNDFGGLVGDMI